MADEQKPKTMDINDLVRELSKSSTSPVAPTPPLAPAPQAPKPSFSTPPSAKPMMPPPMAGSVQTPSMPKSAPSPAIPPLPKPVMPQPKFNVPPPPLSQLSQPKPAFPPVSGSSPATPPPTTPGVKEYQSSIRTMSEDISKIKQGQQPMGVPVPRKVEQVVPAPIQPMSPKPSIPTPQFKVPSVNLGEAQKTGPLAQSKDFSRSGPSIPPPVSVKPVPSKPMTEPKSQIYIPEGGPKAGNRNMLFLGIGVVAIVAGFAYWFFVLRTGVLDVVIESSTPTPTTTPTPTPDLGSVLIGLDNNTICTGGCTVVDDFISSINTGTGIINGGQFKKIYLNENDTSGNMAQVLDDLNILYPVQLKDLLWIDSFLLIYGQKEIFDSKGLIKTDAIVEKRLVFISEVKDAVVVDQLTRAWEVEMASNLKTIFQLDLKKQASPIFMDNSYRGVSVRYNNYKYSDRSIDYAIVTAFNGKDYFVISNSRESMYSTIDKLKGF